MFKVGGGLGGEVNFLRRDPALWRRDLIDVKMNVLKYMLWKLPQKNIFNTEIAEYIFLGLG